MILKIHFDVTIYNTECIFITDDLDDMDEQISQSGRLSGDIFTTGQSMDREPNMGNVPIIPPGTPPMDSWSNFSNMPTGQPFLGRHSPNIPISSSHTPLSNSQMMSMEPIPMMGGPHMSRLMPSDLNDNSQGYSEYPPSTNHNHVEVY